VRIASAASSAAVRVKRRAAFDASTHGPSAGAAITPVRSTSPARLAELQAKRGGALRVGTARLALCAVGRWRSRVDDDACGLGDSLCAARATTGAAGTLFCVQTAAPLAWERATAARGRAFPSGMLRARPTPTKPAAGDAQRGPRSAQARVSSSPTRVAFSPPWPRRPCPGFERARSRCDVPVSESGTRRLGGIVFPCTGPSSAPRVGQHPHDRTAA